MALADTNELARAHDLADLGDPDVGGEATSLTEFLFEVSALLTALGDALDRAHFSHQLPQRVVAVAPAPGSFLQQQQERRA